MVPRLQKRGASFKGVCAYILHDAGKTTTERVDWTATQNLSSHPEDAWFEMYETYRDSDELKAQAGKSSRGRKNTTPVLHYMLSWHKDDKPSPEHMRETAMSSLKALGLKDHQALLSAHHDKDHLHVHIVVNTVNPDNGITAPLKFTKLDLSKWAEAYEKEHGIHCEERIKNNTERERHAKARRLDPIELLTGQKIDATRQLMRASEIKAQAKDEKPYVPVKHKTVSRKQWLEKKEITDRMRAMRATLDAELKGQRDATWQRHQRQRDDLDTRSEAAVERARANVQETFRPKWRELYATQKKEERVVGSLSNNLLDRAVYVFSNRERLGMAGAPLTLRQMLPLIKSGKNLQKRVSAIHEQERRSLAREAKFAGKSMTDAVWTRHKGEMDLLRNAQSAERQSEKDAQALTRKSISFDMAKASIFAERANAPRPFQRAPDPIPVRKPMPPPARFREAQAPPSAPSPPSVQTAFGKAVETTPAPAAPPAVLSRSEQIKRDMAAWKKRNEGKDFGHEM